MRLLQITFADHEGWLILIFAIAHWQVRENHCVMVPTEWWPCNMTHAIQGSCNMLLSSQIEKSCDQFALQNFCFELRDMSSVLTDLMVDFC